ncbi:MAG: hypothetical protein A2806_03630 [Candidatus Terrybacteria bacterium RIFCSPHIGHO2_01_FULL_48_17]|uniref:Uncharacterized protein n=1 Tax=Candidatus Terrybacteria bacterium RIFCSPHIGHO2_01_FULL_48_17 TaxID=1802362 RepID=A0A1G2PIR9_9BACT|nr:MAG: hypothetical protein A2806_03630 [Candidatus Terrybacteria bacterium RIFCSPHIGHO2_01_FULL_48_17]OHA53088.1 MAG: hypothetical protein A3A30_01830 [Candidatus Terrybacteria bacterium RIFCSPLOWO2_01_FULL_48_14]
MDIKLTAGIALFIGGIALFLLVVQPQIQSAHDAEAQRAVALTLFEQEKEDLDNLKRLERGLEDHAQDIIRATTALPSAAVQAAVLSSASGVVSEIKQSDKEAGFVAVKKEDGSLGTITVPAHWNIIVKVGSTVEQNEAIATGPLRSDRPTILTLFNDLKDVSGIGLENVAFTEQAADRTVLRQAALQKKQGGEASSRVGESVAVRSAAVSIVATQKGLRSFLKFAAQSLRLLEPTTFKFSVKEDDPGAANSVPVGFKMFVIP